jgi:hypothetical protein
VRRIAWGVAIALVAVTGCSSSGKDAPETTVPATAVSTTVVTAAASTTSSSSTTTSSPTTTSLAPTTVAPPPTDSASTVRETSIAPSITLDPSTVVLAQAVDRFYEGYIPCVQSPSTCDPTTFISSQGGLLATMRSQLAEKVANGEHTSTDTRGTHWVVQLAQFIDEAKGSAVTCVFDALIVLGPPGPDGESTVVDDSTGSYTYVFTIYRDGDRWLVGDASGTGKTQEPTDKCAAS